MSKCGGRLGSHPGTQNSPPPCGGLWISEGTYWGQLRHIALQATVCSSEKKMVMKDIGRENQLFQFKNFQIVKITVDNNSISCCK